MRRRRVANFATKGLLECKLQEARLTVADEGRAESLGAKKDKSCDCIRPVLSVGTSRGIAGLARR